MRRLDFDHTTTDSKRMYMAANHAHFGFPDPLGDLKQKGFAVRQDSNRSIIITFQNHIVAIYAPKNGTWGALRVSDHLPTEVDSSIVKIFNAIKDTARSIDLILKADARDVAARIKSVQHTGPNPNVLAFSKDALIRIAAVPQNPDDLITVSMNPFNAYIPHVYFNMKFRSAGFPENDKEIYQAFRAEDDGLHKISFLPSEPFMTDLSAKADVVYAAVMQRLDITPRETAPDFDAATLEHWKNMKGRLFDTAPAGFTFRDRHQAVEVSFDDVRVLTASIGRDGVVCLHDSTLPDTVKNALLHDVKTAILAQDSSTPVNRLSEQEALRTLAAEALASLNTGYGF